LGQRYHYVATAEGWLYLAVILDLFSRRVVGWKLGDSFGKTQQNFFAKEILSSRQD
jgi:transposase InsO family protein